MANLLPVSPIWDSQSCAGFRLGFGNFQGSIDADVTRLLYRHLTNLSHTGIDWAQTAHSSPGGD
jgi:hypothetical protein